VAPTLRLTLEVPLSGDGLPPQLAHLLDLARDLVDQSAGTVAVTRTVPRFAGPYSDPSATPDGSGSFASGTAADEVSGDDPLPATPPASGVDAGGPAVGRDEALSLHVLTGPRVVLRAGRPLPLTRLEFDLLLFLARHPRRVFTRTQLLASVWGYQHAVARTVDVHIRRLRAKVGDGVPLVTTVHGVGYRLADEARVQVDGDEVEPGAG